MTCPPSDGWFGENGWRDWPDELKVLCDEQHLPSGWPVYAPCGIRERVHVMWVNGYSLKDMPAVDVDWGSAGLVARFLRP